MAARKHMNAEDRMTPFLSQSKGEVIVETPDGIQTGVAENLGAYAEGPSGMMRMYGSRSGMGKQTSVK